MSRSLVVLGAVLVAAVSFAGCSDDETTTPTGTADSGTTTPTPDASSSTDGSSTPTDSGGTPDTGSNPDTSAPSPCVAYCECMGTTCAGKLTDCATECEAQTTWDMTCRTTHCGLAGSDPGTHCPHAAGENTCD